MRNIKRLQKGKTYTSSLDNSAYKYVGRYMNKYEFVKDNNTTVIISRDRKVDLNLKLN